MASFYPYSSSIGNGEIIPNPHLPQADKPVSANSQMESTAAKTSTISITYGNVSALLERAKMAKIDEKYIFQTLRIVLISLAVALFIAALVSNNYYVAIGIAPCLAGIIISGVKEGKTYSSIEDFEILLNGPNPPPSQLMLNNTTQKLWDSICSDPSIDNPRKKFFEKHTNAYDRAVEIQAGKRRVWW